MMEPHMLHEKVQPSHAVVTQAARVSLSAAVQLSVCLVLRALGRDVRASVAPPQGPRDAPPRGRRARTLHGRFAAAAVNPVRRNLAAGVVDRTRVRRWRRKVLDAILHHFRAFVSVFGPFCPVDTVLLFTVFTVLYTVGGSVAEWLACRAQAQKGPGSNRSRDAVG